MPFSLKLTFEDDDPVTFRGWLEGSFGEKLVEDSPFAEADRNGVAGFIVVNGPMILLERADIKSNTVVTKGTFLTEAAAEGDEIPYGQPFCRFAEDVTLGEAWQKEIARRLRQIEAGEVELIDSDVVFREAHERLARLRERKASSE
jgi:hypothetical protein